MTHFDPHTINEEPLVYFPDGDPAARIGLTMTFYFGAPGREDRRKALVRCIQHYLKQAQGQLRLYAVAGDKRHRKLKPNETLDIALLDAMVDPNRVFEFEAGVEEGVSCSWSVGALAKNVLRPTFINYLLFTYPLSILKGSGLEGFIRQFVSICNGLQVEHAYGGLGLILPFDVGGMNAAHQIIGEIAMQYPGLDAYDLTGVSINCQEGIKSINFLTAVSHRLLQKAGGADAVTVQAGASVQTCPYSNGVVFQAGAVPQLGSQDHPPEEYVALGRALKPARAPYLKTMFYDPAGLDDEAFTQRWLGRFDG